MKAKHRIVIIVFVSISLMLTNRAQAQTGRSWNWTRWDVTISNINTSANTFHVSETQVINITQGQFRGGDRSVSLDRVTDITNITVRDDDTLLTKNDAISAFTCPDLTGNYCVFRISGNFLDIYYNFASRASVGDTHIIQIDYDVAGALRSYPGGDQLWWSPLASSRDYNVLASTVIVQMPTAHPAQQMTSYPSNWKVSLADNVVTFSSPGRIGPTDAPEIRIQYAHDPAMSAPPWQANYDREVAQTAQAESLNATLSLILGAIGLLVCISGPLLALILFLVRGRDPQPVVVPDYLAEPPSDTPPAVVSTLLDERPPQTAIMASLLDLAQRGYMVIEHPNELGMFFTGLVFHRAASQAPQPDATTAPETSAAAPQPQPSTKLRLYEESLLHSVFAGGDSIKMSDLVFRLPEIRGRIETNLYELVVREGYFKESPQNVRNSWRLLGGALLLGAIVLLVGAFIVLQHPVMVIPLLLGLAVTGIAFLITSRHMPAKTALGSQEAAKWRAFRKYLANIKTYTTVDQATQQFDRYLGYAVVFGLDKHWIETFTPVMTETPTWYHSTYRSGHGYNSHPVSLDGINPLGGSHGLSDDLNSMNDGLTHGLTAMSSGLTSMLNSSSGSSNKVSADTVWRVVGAVIQIGLEMWSGGGSGKGGSSGGGHAGGH